MIYSGLIKLIESPLFLGLMADAEDVDVTAKAKTCCKSNDIRFFSIEKHVTFWFTNLASVLVWAVF